MLTQEQKDKLFDRVCDPKDWRASINAVIDASEFDDVADAISHFTATYPEIVQHLPEGKVRIHAAGYRMGPAGP